MPPKKKDNQPVSQTTDNSKNGSPKSETPKKNSAESGTIKSGTPEPGNSNTDAHSSVNPKKDNFEPVTPKKDISKADSLNNDSPMSTTSKNESPTEDTHKLDAPRADNVKGDKLKNDKPNPATPEKIDTSDSRSTTRKDEPKSKPVTMSPENPEEAIKEKELGNAAYKKKDFDAALKHYDKAFELDPKNITFLTNKSAVYFEMGDYENCLKTCELAISRGRELRSDFKLIAKAFARMGHCYEKQSDFENAKKFYDKSLSEFRAPDIIKKAQALDKQMKEAERKAYINPELAEQEKLKGNKAFSDGKFPEALKFYTEAIKRNPDDVRLYSNRAACYSKLMEFACALKDCETCVTLDPTFIKGYLRKASCLFAMKDITSARNAYRKALELDPNCQEARDGLKRCMTTEPDKEAARQRAANDPEIREILTDPAMRMILNQMQNPNAMKVHLRNPEIASKLMKLIDAGIIALR